MKKQFITIILITISSLSFAEIDRAKKTEAKELISRCISKVLVGINKDFSVCETTLKNLQISYNFSEAELFEVVNESLTEEKLRIQERKLINPTVWKIIDQMNSSEI